MYPHFFNAASNISIFELKEPVFYSTIFPSKSIIASTLSSYSKLKLSLSAKGSDGHPFKYGLKNKCSSLNPLLYTTSSKLDFLPPAPPLTDVHSITPKKYKKSYTRMNRLPFLGKQSQISSRCNI